MDYRYSQKSALASYVPVFIFYFTVATILLILIYPKIALLKSGLIVSLTLFALWRYGWMVTHYIRAAIYSKIVYPKIRRQMLEIPQDQRYPKQLFFIIPSYKEEAWVSVEAFRSILSEIQKVPSEVTIIVSTSSSSEDAVIAKMFDAYKNEKECTLLFQHQKEGKRIAMGHALRAISRKWHAGGFEDANSVTILMDGDSYLEEGFLEKLLPIFATDHKLGAVTTNEVAFIDTNNRWYKEWFKLKFGQRHIQFQSHSLSKKVMTLTGRLSAYRTSIAIEEAFIKIVENDILIHPLFGKFRFLMGDDKSTWFFLLKNGYHMRYIPDAVCYSLESRVGDFLSLSLSLPFRWNGNTLRNNHRALALGPGKTGLFIWFVILDQRLNMWTSLVGITSALLLGIFKSFYYLLFFFVWIMYVRVIQLGVIALGGHAVSLYSLPLMLYLQWVGAIVKINAYYDLANQKWSKNGQTQNNDANTAMIKHPLASVTPKIFKYSAITGFIFFLILGHGILKLPRLDASATSNLSTVAVKKTSEIDLGALGVKEGGKNNALIINTLIQNHSNLPLVLQLPSGKIDLFEPIIIDSDHVTLKGAGKEKTTLVSHLSRPHEAVIQVAGKEGEKIGILSKESAKNSNRFFLKRFDHASLSKYLLLKEPNSQEFLDHLGAKKWNKKYPFLRQQIVQVKQYDENNTQVTLEKPLLLEGSKGMQVHGLEMRQNVHLQDFKILQLIPSQEIEKYRFVYENSFLDYRVDAIRFTHAASCSVQNVAIVQSGSHALVFENCYAMKALGLSVDGSWNKGKEGNGYMRISRTYYSEVAHSTFSNIRHLALQWSSAGNHFHHLNMEVDLNLHGGFTHDNRIDHLTFYISKRHLWQPIERTPEDAGWAPPDGENFIDFASILIK